MIIWETKFFAISRISGALEEFRGAFIEAPTLVDASTILSKDALDHLQLTGRSYPSIEAVEREVFFYNQLEDDSVHFSNMSFDQVYDWLKTAPTVEDLEIARERIIEEGNMSDYIPLIERLIKEHGEKDSSEESSDQG